MASLTISITISAILGISIKGLIKPSLFSSRALSAMFTAWSPMRSNSVIIFIIVKTKRRSSRTGWRIANKRKHSCSTSTSIMSTSSSFLMTSRARSSLFFIMAPNASSIARSTKSAIAYSCLKSQLLSRSKSPPTFFSLVFRFLKIKFLLPL